MKEKNPTYGIIVARFQVPSLHDGHKDLINFVKSRHDKCIVILGLAPFMYTYNNPLDFETRKLMINQEYNDINVYYINDCYSDEEWSDNLDSLIEKITKDKLCNRTILYGSRDSFIKYYSGRYETYEYKPRIIISGTEIREKISKEIKSTYDYRAGIIKATSNAPSFVIPTVDVLFLDYNNNEILLGRKKKENKYCFVGAYAQPKETWKDVAIRVCKDKLNVDVSWNDVHFFDSYFIDDWKWKGERNKITTTLMEIVNISGGNFEAKGNIIELRWFPFIKETVNKVIDHHKDMYLDVLNRINI